MPMRPLLHSVYFWSTLKCTNRVTHLLHYTLNQWVYQNLYVFVYMIWVQIDMVNRHLASYRCHLLTLNFGDRLCKWYHLKCKCESLSLIYKMQFSLNGSYADYIYFHKLDQIELKNRLICFILWQCVWSSIGIVYIGCTMYNVIDARNGNNGFPHIYFNWMANQDQLML